MPPQFIAEHRLSKRPLPALASAIRPLDVDIGFALQVLANERLSRAGLGKAVGHQVGATNSVLQQRLCIPHPVAGEVFAAIVHQRNANLRHADYVRPGIECEVVVQLGQDLPPRSAPY